MVAKSQIKLIKSLHLKKNRVSNGLFIVEGIKGISDALSNQLKPYMLCATTPEDWPEQSSAKEFQKVSIADLSQMSALKSPNGFLAVFHIPTPKNVDFSQWVLALDGVQDPGNLGTIIRLSDWFGISHILCSSDTVDAYNPKVVQATMGSIGRVQIHYVDLAASLADTKLPILGTFMEGQPISKVSFSSPGIILLGNEANGISSHLEKIVTQKMNIPSHLNSKAESLNVANAAAIVLYEMSRA